jgi:tetratricopeptide (TPR) repeat protein
LRTLLADQAEAELLRADAASRLARVEGLAAAPALIAALADDSSLLLQRYAADLLGSLGARADLPLSERATHFGRLQDAGVPDALRSVVDGGPAALRLAAASSLARLGASDGMARLEALRDDPDLAQGYRLHQALGKYYLLAQNLPEAAEAYETVLQRTPNHLAVIQDLGFVYFATQRFREARDLWMRGLTLAPDNEDLRLKIHLAEDEMRSRGQLQAETGS